MNHGDRAPRRTTENLPQRHEGGKEHKGFEPWRQYGTEKHGGFATKAYEGAKQLKKVK